MSVASRTGQRLRRSSLSTVVRRYGRRTKARISPSARAEARTTALPRRYRWLRIGSAGRIDGPVGQLVVRNLLERPLRPRERQIDLVLVPGVSLGGPDRLDGPMVDVLIACERSSTRTVLVAAAPTDLRGPLIAVCRDVISDDNATIDQARRLVGEARTHATSSGSSLSGSTIHPAGAWVETLSTLVE